MVDKVISIKQNDCGYKRKCVYGGFLPDAQNSEPGNGVTIVNEHPMTTAITTDRCTTRVILLGGYNDGFSAMGAGNGKGCAFHRGCMIVSNKTTETVTRLLDAQIHRLRVPIQQS